jgi:hypothetical protein
MFSYFPHVIALLGLSSLIRCYIPVVTDVSSWMSALSRFLLQHCTWPNFSAICLAIGPLWPHPLLHAVPAQRDIRLRAAANFFQDPPSSQVHFWSCRRNPMARCWSPYHFFSTLTAFTAASSLGTSSCIATDSTSTNVGSLLSRQASVASWQAVIYFYQPLISTMIPL